MESSYVLVTPVHNEQATIEITVRSVLAQTVPPREWIIVNDRSTDRTAEIINHFAQHHDFIRPLHLTGAQQHSFAAVVRATEAGIKNLKTTDYEFLGLLDADVRFAPEYYQSLMARFDADPKLGLAGGLVVDVGVHGRRKSYQNLNEVAGATQFFRRRCFESLGGLVAIPEGGWDAITCARARMNGYHTRTFPDLVMEHLKPRNAAFGNPLRRYWQLGVRDYALARHPVFELFKCASRAAESPYVFGAASQLLSFAVCGLKGKKTNLPPDLAAFIRREQLTRIWPFARKK